VTKIDELVRSLDKLQLLVVQVSENTRGAFASELEKTRDKVLSEAQKTRGEIAAESEDTRNHVLESLAFSEMNARYNAILTSHKSTFEWIYDGGTKYHDSDDFVVGASKEAFELKKHSKVFYDWLKSENSLFWMNEKPGSGKSTLMKFLVEHPRTKASLHAYDPSTLIISSFVSVLLTNMGIRMCFPAYCISRLLHFWPRP
jgi:hypothetical protein